MNKYFVETKLKNKLLTLYKKDRKRYFSLMNKIEEIIASSNIDHYKNLKKPLHNLKRVHIDAHFVLVFKYNKTKDIVYFCDFDHHDNIYK